jgi:hypothetical protein
MTMQRFTDKAVFLPWDTIEAEAKNQILNTAKMPFVFQHIAVMPDCHYGRGATVGTALPTKGAIIPAAVGVDIGCGMIGCPYAAETYRHSQSGGRPRRYRASYTDERRQERCIDRNSRGKVDTLVQLAKDTRATPDQFDKKWSLALGTRGR